MSKQTDDLIGGIEGSVTALKGVRVQLSPIPPPEPASPPPIDQEVWDHAKKVVAQLKSQVDALEAEVSRESKVPEATQMPAPKSSKVG